MRKDEFEKKLNSGGGRDGGKIHTMTRMAQLKRCEDASKNDRGWLVSDWRWISGIFEVGLMDIRTDIRTYRRTDPLIEMRGRI